MQCRILTSRAITKKDKAKSLRLEQTLSQIPNFEGSEKSKKAAGHQTGLWEGTAQLENYEFP
jgi:hypothetical protein